MELDPPVLPSVACVCKQALNSVAPVACVEVDFARQPLDGMPRACLVTDP
jgi:hypothetical protein